VHHDVFVGVGDGGEVTFAGPGGDDLVGEGAHDGDEEGAGAHGGVADLEGEQGAGGGFGAHGGEQGLEGAADDRLGEAAGGVVGAGAAALFAGLDDEAAGGGEIGVFGAEVGEDGEGLVFVFGAVQGGGELAGLGFGEADGVLAKRRRAAALGRASSSAALTQTRAFWPHAQAERAAGQAEHVVAHEGLVDAADLLDVEGAVGEALALEEEQALEDLKDGAVVDAGDAHGGALLVELR
jgi:hypothetical protein